ncbi:Uncharacterised protein [Mycobacterium tuberculosis]|nr:Uncharacterised protein [Mycobacterium tuberculosis]
MPLRWVGARRNRSLSCDRLVGRGGHGLAVGVALALTAMLLQVPAVVSPSAVYADEPTAASREAASEDQASKLAVKSGDRVEVLSKRGEQRTVMALPTGGFEVIEHLRPVRTRQSGKWEDIDLALARSGDALIPKATTVGVRFSSGGDGPLVVMERDGRTLEFSWPTKLPKPVVSGEVATYQGVLGDDVDLQVRARADGFTHTLVVKSAKAAADTRLAKLALGMKTKGLKVSQSQDGLLTAADSGSGAPVFEAPQPVMWDSSGRPAPQPKGRSASPEAADPAKGPLEGAKTARLGTEIAGGRLTLVPDRGLLTAADTKFPVFIDPVWGAKKASSWAMVSSGYPSQSYYLFNGKSTEGLGRCEVAKDPNCVTNQTKRLFYRIPLPSLPGAHVDAAEFVAYETYAYDCSNPTSVQLYRTSALSASATWNNTSGSWGEHLASRDVAYCSKAPVEFGGANLRSHVQSAIDNGNSSITFGLRAYSESSMSWWKRFADDAYLRINYNRPPNQPDTDTMFANPGTKCLPAGQAKTVNAIPTVYAYLSDPDNEDANKVRGQFTLHWANNADGSDWGEKWTSSLTPALSSGSRHQIKLPSTIPVNTRIGWGVRAYDGTQYGPWSYSGAQTGCYFYYDPSVPGEPTISSQEYPADGSWKGGVGEQGRFAISDTEGVANRYEVTLNDNPSQTVQTTDGAERSVVLVPDRAGPNIVTVQAFASSGQNGPSVSYEFNVNAGADPVAHYKLDENAGAAKVASSGPGWPVSLTGSAALGAEGKNGTALSMDGVFGFAESNLPVADTSDSFTVSAWVKPTEYGMKSILAQNATFQSAFQLGIETQGKPVFKKPSTDTVDGGGGTWQQAIADTPLPTGEWSHLAGVYDKSAQQLRLYVNGELQATANDVTPLLDAHGSLEVGRGLYNGTFTNYWPGSIDDVQAFTQPLSDVQAQQLADGTTPSGVGQVAHWNMDEPQGNRRAYSETTWPATVHGGATLGTGGQVGTALSLDNTAQQYAATEQPVVNTLRSFAVSAWLKVDGSATSPTKNFTAVSVRGNSKSGFYLKYVEENDTWVFARTAQDSDDEGWYQATFEGARTDEWTHVVGVYDSVAQRLKIYVNGEEGTDSPVVDSRWLATGPLEIGRSQWGGNPVDYWAGQIDDVRIYDRIIGLSEAEKMITHRPVLKARWAMNDQPVNTKINGEPSWAPQLALHGGATIDPNASFLGLPFPLPGYAGLQLEEGGFADSTGKVLRTDESFTIAGWVRTPEIQPGEVRTVFSQAGDNVNAVELRYAPREGGAGMLWQAEMRNDDDSAADPLVASYLTSFFPHEWTHLAVVYDALRNRLNLYVDGSIQSTGEQISQAGQVLGFDKPGSVLQIGRDGFGGTEGAGSKFWAGPVDDVWAYQGALTGEQVASLAVSIELETPGVIGSDVVFRATAGFNDNTENAVVTVPSQVQVGDGMLLFLTLNRADVSFTPPSGWTQVDEMTNGDSRSLLWQKTAGSADLGSQVSVPISDWTKADMLLAAYAGTGSPPVVASVKATDVAQSEHQVPAVTVDDAGDWVVWYWAEKSSSTTTWTPPEAGVLRASSVGSGGGRVSSLLVDSGQGVSSGTQDPLTATTDMESGRGNMWALVLSSD